MANNNEVQTKKSSSKPNPEQSKQATPQIKTKAVTISPKILLLLGLLSVVMAIIALVCGVYALRANQHLASKTDQETQALSTEFDNLKQQQQEAQSLETNVNKLSQEQMQLQAHIKTLDKELQTALNQRLYQKQDWLLLKARYYLELAQVNAHWSNDQQTTLVLLQQADTLLVTLSDQSVFPIRQAIAQEIAQLQTLPKLDITGLLSQLDAIEDNLSDLPLKQPLANVLNNSASEKSSTQWREQLRESINSLGKLIVIRHHGEAVQPLLSPTQQTMLEETIRLNLEEAQWALLQNNPDVYQLALTKAIKTIKRTFDETAPSTQAVIKQLTELKQQKLSLTKPVIDKALPLLNKLIESKNLQSNTSVSKEGEHSQ